MSRVLGYQVRGMPAKRQRVLRANKSTLELWCERVYRVEDLSECLFLAHQRIALVHLLRGHSVSDDLIRETGTLMGELYTALDTELDRWEQLDDDELTFKERCGRINALTQAQQNAILRRHLCQNDPHYGCNGFLPLFDDSKSDFTPNGGLCMGYGCTNRSKDCNGRIENDWWTCVHCEAARHTRRWTAIVAAVEHSGEEGSDGSEDEELV